MQGGTQYAMHRWLGVILIALCALVAALISNQVAYQHAITSQAAAARRALANRAEALESYIDRYRIMPAVLALDPQLQATLQDPANLQLRQRANDRLEQLNFSNHTSTLTLIDHDGLGVAASNWREKESNVGHAFHFRPYFVDAMRNGEGEFYAVGVVTNIPGYFIARAIRDVGHRTIGVISVKVALESLETEWGTAAETVLLADKNGVIFLANRPAWRYRMLAPQSVSQLAELHRTHQYGNQRLAASELSTQRRIDAETRIVSVSAPRAGNNLLLQSHVLPKEGWTLYSLEDTRASVHAGWLAAGTATGLWLLLVAIGIVLEQRHRIARIKLRGEEDLKHLIEHHAQALRHAQDDVLQAAQEVDRGQRYSLDHLPQGVSVVDKDLNLVAWNRRYAELFHYPPELLRVGRPIADLIRYNARQGFLGAGDSDEAVERHLARLRTNQSYVHERVASDGTVVEVRGNPLPSGGFVTSYVDITTYRQAARDLRSMIEGLEDSIRERTRDLQIASIEAERANRSKTRFVAAAVHDLLQPVNAARLYLSTLRNHITPSGQELARHIDTTLDTQEDILSSLLDISRLESGALEVHLGDFHLSEIFSSLKSQFEPQATARGLRFDVVPTRATIVSDPVLLRRAIQNFLSNSLKFTAVGGRVVLGSRRQRDRIRIEVWDTGPGIAEHQRELIFEEFRRLDIRGSVPENGTQGSGLGLAIVRHIARLLDHAVEVRSWPGCGSAFSIGVPRSHVTRIPDRGADKEDEKAFHACNVWVVDDDAGSGHAAQALLESWGCNVLLFATASDALAASSASAMPELILLDHGLGETSGFDLSDDLQALWHTLPPVVMVTGDALPDLRTRCRSRGWGFLAKPVRPAALRALISHLLGVSSA